ncbi:alpha/beta-hydrolase [Ganoderma leucocontextum]|nr:alpha/beta-hydrolase [Ganoderma leucocontextum]
MKLLENRRSEIENHPRKTFQFGNTDRHQLDVYYPDPGAVSSNGPVPVLFFIYGGGFVFGERKEKPPFDLGYTNLGVFFAKRGILTVIPDYRLYPSVSYPAPVEDVRDAIAWFLANTSTVASAAPSTLSPSTPLSNIFVLSHSAGTNHLASLYLSPSLLPLDSPVRAATRGLIPQGSAYYFDLARQDLLPPGILDGYYSSPENAVANMPLTLLKDGSEELIKGLPEIFVLKSEREPPVIYAGSDVFVKVLEERLGKKVRYDVMQAHNHISPHWALMSGEGEEWAEDVATWVKERV